MLKDDKVNFDYRKISKKNTLFPACPQSGCGPSLRNLRKKVGVLKCHKTSEKYTKKELFIDCLQKLGGGQPK